VESPILEFRVALTVQDYKTLFALYTEGFGLEPAELWTTETTHAALFEMGRGTLELFDEPHAASVDEIEVGKRVSGSVRFALRVKDVDAAVEKLVAKGATLVHAPVMTPWGDYNGRLQTPDGLQITLFQADKTKPG
jgi:uncharacterized glyoxalase superfamily protein PhnB